MSLPKFQFKNAGSSIQGKIFYFIVDFTLTFKSSINPQSKYITHLNSSEFFLSYFISPTIPITTVFESISPL